MKFSERPWYQRFVLGVILPIPLTLVCIILILFILPFAMIFYPEACDVDD